MKEYELEVMRDTKDNVIIICSIRKLRSDGVHTATPLPSPRANPHRREYQMMRDASIAVIRESVSRRAGSNIPVRVNPSTGRMVVIEMNPASRDRLR